MSATALPFGLYVHIPFCPQRCPYCAFTILTGHTALYDRYVQAVCAEMQQWQSLASKGPLHTLYIGGGTPTLLTPVHIEQILSTAARLFGIADGAEITLEANPNPADVRKFAAFRALGCTRLSLGVQSLHDTDLKILGRQHSAAEAEAAYHGARRAGFAAVNMDVIFSIPGTPRAHWHRTLQQLIALQPEHISTYALTIEEGTHFAQRHHQGRLQPVSEDDDAWAYHWAMETLHAAGYAQYEVSNFARPGHRSRHNWGYWTGAEYLGVGLSAHSFLDQQRHWNLCDIRAYLDTVLAGHRPIAGQERLDPIAARHERLWLQLRTCEGILLEPDELQALLPAAKFQAMLNAGFLHQDGLHIRLTPQGFLLADAIGVEMATLLEHGVRHVGGVSPGWTA